MTTATATLDRPKAASKRPAKTAPKPAVVEPADLATAAATDDQNDATEPSNPPAEPAGPAVERIWRDEPAIEPTDPRSPLDDAVPLGQEPGATPAPTPVEPTAPTAGPRLTPDQLRDRRTGLQLSREMLATFAGISPSRVWASEQDNKIVSDEHYAAIVTALEKVEALPLAERNPKAAAPAKHTRDELRVRIANARTALGAVGGTRSITEIRHIVALALALLDGKSTEPAPTADATDAAATDETKSEA